MKNTGCLIRGKRVPFPTLQKNEQACHKSDVSIVLVGEGFFITDDAERFGMFSGA